MSKKITQLTDQRSAKEVLPRDLFLFAGPNTRTPTTTTITLVQKLRSEQILQSTPEELIYDNFKVSTTTLAHHVCLGSNAVFPFAMEDTKIESPGTESNVSNMKYDLCDIQSLTFNKFGVATEVGVLDSSKRLFTGACGTINPVTTDTLWEGYFDKSVVGTRTPSTATWEDFFSTSYSNYKKTIVNYVAKAATNNYQTCTHKVIIYWGTTNNAVASGCGQYPSIRGDVKNYIIGTFPTSESVSSSNSTEFPVQLEIDRENKKIVKLPITNYNVTTTEKIYISMTVESFA